MRTPLAAAAFIVPSFASFAFAVTPPLSLQPVVSTGLSSPLYVTTAPGDASRLFILEKGGNVRLFDKTTDTLSLTPYLTLPVATTSERGLLGLTFSPDFATSGNFYVSYTRSGAGADLGDLVVERYSANGSPLTSTTANTTGTPIITIEHTAAANHNGGWLGFSPNNTSNLYISTGDGGGGNDPNNNAQNDNVLLGKMLRLDVSAGGSGYAIPADNPFASTDGVAGEIWAKGLRNAWRPSFDRANGNFYIADVGQGAREEVNFQPASSAGGANYGWRAYEGTIETPGLESDPNPPGVTFPVHEYNHTIGQSITGGYVYRGSLIPELQGTYLFGDYVSGKVFSFAYSGTGTVASTDITSMIDPTGTLVSSLASFGEDANGELYVVDFGGQVYQIVPEPAAAAAMIVGLGFGDAPPTNTAEPSRIVTNRAGLILSCDACVALCG